MKWPTVNLPEICRPRQWKVLSKKEMSPVGYPVYGANGRIGFSETFTHEKPVILIGCRGTCGSVHVTEPKSYANGNAMALDNLDESRINLEFLASVLRGADFSKVITGVAQPQITGQSLARFQIPLPPLAEQKRIAAILDAADALRAKRREALAQLDALLQSTFLTLFGDPVANPMGWPMALVQNVCSLVRGSSPRPQGDSRYFGGSVPRLMVGDITRDGFKVTPKIDSLTEEGAKKSRPVPRGTVVMAVSGNVGLVATVQVPCCVHDGFVAFLDLDTRSFDSAYFMFQFHFLKATHEQRKAGAIFQNITTTDIKNMNISKPPLPLQQKFAAIVESIERQKTTQRAHLAELDALFAALQHRAFRGEL